VRDERGFAEVPESRRADRRWGRCHRLTGEGGGRLAERRRQEPDLVKEVEESLRFDMK